MQADRSAMTLCDFDSTLANGTNAEEGVELTENGDEKRKKEDHVETPNFVEKPTHRREGLCGEEANDVKILQE